MLWGREPSSGRELVMTRRAPGVLATRYLRGAPEAGFVRKRVLLRALGAEIARLHAAGFIHGDLTPFNVIADESPTISFIDHERTRRVWFRRIAARARRRNLVQLGRFAFSGLTRRDRMRLWSSYAAATAPALGRAELRRVLKMLDARIARDGAPEIFHAPQIPAARRSAGGLMEKMIDQTAKISVVIPVFNEVATIGTIIDRALNCGFDAEVIVVDDGSSDGTAEFLRKFEHPKVRCYFHSHNKGKGAALRLGFAAAANPYVFVQDADLEYDPNDYRLMIGPLIDGRADMVYGSRFLGGPHRVLFYWHYFGNRMLTLVSNIISDLNLSDMETGQKAFVRDKLMQLKLSADRFNFEPEITAKAARARWRIYEVPISYSGRTYEEGKKIGWRDAIAAIGAIFYYRFFD